MKIGYARVSTTDQDISLQVEELERYGCEKIFEDTCSGSKVERSGFSEMYNMLREGDEVVVWKLDRLGRTVKQLINLLDDFNSRNIKFLSITDNIDTQSTMGKMMFHLLAMFAEMERNLIIERTKRGLEKARARGRRGGPKFKLTKGQQRMLFNEYQQEGTPVDQLCKEFEISISTLYRYINQYQKEKKND